MKSSLLLVLLCLCSLGQTEEPTQAAADASAPAATEEVKKEEHQQKEEEEVDSCDGKQFSPEQHRAIGGAIELLGLQLLENLPISRQQPNVVVSPLSLSVALAQLALGARNETQQLLMQTLHAADLPCFHHTLSRLLPHFRNTSLEVASRTYLRPGFDVKLTFVEESLARYQSRPVPLVSVEEVNQWVENATNGHITNFLESIPHDVVLLLMNAVYFKGQWQTRFDPQKTKKADFYLDSKNSRKVSADMMTAANYPLRLLHHQELQAQVASFPFNGNSSFLIVMPLVGNVSALIPRLNIADLYSRLPPPTELTVHLPKLKLQYNQELQEALTSMGLGSLFSSPDLSGISDYPLKVSEVRHASTVELNEDGVEASGVTSVSVLRTLASHFHVNSPFLFALVDDASLTPLFMGVVTNPAPNNNPMTVTSHQGSNATMSDQPAADSNGKNDLNMEHVNRSCSVMEGGAMPTCSAPSGANEPLQVGPVGRDRK